MTTRTWTEFDLDIVSALTCQVRVLSLDQIRRGWKQPTEDSRRQLARLVSSKLIQTVEWMVVPPPIDRAPMFVWKPGELACRHQQLLGFRQLMAAGQFEISYLVATEQKARRLFAALRPLEMTGVRCVAESVPVLLDLLIPLPAT